MCIRDRGITANETESLALSGIAYAKNFYFNGDPRLVEDVHDVEPSQMLRNTEKLRVVSHAPSRNYCRHQGRRGLRARSLRGAPRGQGAV